MCSFSAPRGLAEVLATFLGPGKVSGPCRHVVGQRRLLATGGLFVAGNGRVRLEEITARWVPVEYISGFSSPTPSSCTI